MYCPTANLIVADKKSTNVVCPGDDDDNCETDLQAADPRHELREKDNGAILETDSLGNSYLHLILPADRVNFLNGNNSASFFDPDFKGKSSSEG